MTDTASFALMAVSDRARVAGGDLVSWARACADGGVDLLQVREKDMADGALLAVVAAIVETVAGSRSRVLVNGRPDIAQAAGAHGVQLPEDGLPVRGVRAAFPGLRVGASCHSVEACRRAQEEGAHHVVLGPVLATPGKEARVLGLGVLREAARAVRVPVFAIGGVTAEEAGALAAAGAQGLAAIRAFLGADAARSAARMRSAAAGAHP